MIIVRETTRNYQKVLDLIRIIIAASRGRGVAGRRVHTAVGTWSEHVRRRSRRFLSILSVRTRGALRKVTRVGLAARSRTCRESLPWTAGRWPAGAGIGQRWETLTREKPLRGRARSRGGTRTRFRGPSKISRSPSLLGSGCPRGSGPAACRAAVTRRRGWGPGRRGWALRGLGLGATARLAAVGVHVAGDGSC